MYSEKWKKILDEVDDFAQRCSGATWFRGHSSVGFSLKAGLFREEGGQLNDYLKIERTLYRNYKNIGCLLHDNESGWQLLYSMQHHGVKTRLLDWTESFVNALYFATCGWHEGAAELWLLDPQRLNGLAIKKLEIISPEEESLTYPEDYLTKDAVEPLAIYPIKNTKRISSQHGVFTVQGNSLLSLNEEFDGQLMNNGYLIKLELERSLYVEILRFIRQNGINHFTLFPDLDGLARYLNAGCTAL